MIVDSPVPDITWLLPDEEQPRGVEIIYELPKDLQEIQVNVSIPLIAGPNHDERIVNSTPLPEYIVKVQQISFNDQRYGSPYGPEVPHLQDVDPAKYIATRFTRRHVYRLEDNGIALAYWYLGWWKP